MKPDPPPDNSLAAFSLRRPVTTCVLFIFLIVMGLISIGKIPLVLFPDVEFPFLFVNATFPNATPGQIQESITKPLEEILSTIPGVERMSSRSGRDSSSIQLFFAWDANMAVLRSEVRGKLDQIRGELPEDIEHLSIRSFGLEDAPVVEVRIASDRDLRTSADFLDLKIKRPLERLPGVADVEIWGVQRQETDIYLRLDDIKRYRVDVGQLFGWLDQVNLNRSLGRVVDGGIRYGALSHGTISNLEELGELPVNGRGLTLNDIADIEYDSPAANSGQHLNGGYTVGFKVRKASDANTVQTVDRVLEKIDEIRQSPGMEGIELMPWRDSGKEITKSLVGLLTAGGVGALLAVVILIFFLRRLSATLIVAVSIPFSIISALAFLYLSGQTLNVLTMMGLMLSAGMLVDNAIVVLEAIYQKLERGIDRETAALTGTKEVYTAVLASTATSIIIFVPLIFGEQTNFSVWLRHTGLAIVFALLCSLFISLTLIPLAMGRLLKVDLKRQSRWHRWLSRRGLERLLPGTVSDAKEGRITDYYLRLVAWPLRHRFLVGLVLVPLIVFGSGWMLLNKVPDNSPDAQELGSLEIEYEFSENFHYAKIEADYVGRVESFLLENRERFKIADVFSRYGNDDARTNIYFEKEDLSPEEIPLIRKQIADGLPVIPGAKIGLGRQGGAQNQEWIMVSLYGEDPQTLVKLSAEAREQLLARPGFTQVNTPLDRAQEEVQIQLRRSLARKYGISSRSVSDVLAIVMRGRQVRGFRTSEGEVDITVWLAQSDRDSLEDLKSVIVGSGTEGQPIQLSQVADLRIRKVPGEIQREDRRTFAQLFAIYTGAKKDEGMKHVREVMDDFDFPSGYGWSFGFWTKRSQNEDKDFLFNILLALFMVYFVMASLFESISHPFAIMFSLPFSVVGIAWFLFLTGTPFNLMARIGILVLMGVSVNNGIVLIDHINNLRRQGKDRLESLLDGCRERFRPIVMTAGTTVVGLIPLAFSDTSLFQLRYFPMARTVMGGLLASTILTLVVLPTYYILFDDLGIWLRRIWHNSGLAAAGDAATRPLKGTKSQGPNSQTNPNYEIPSH